MRSVIQFKLPNPQNIHPISNVLFRAVPLNSLDLLPGAGMPGGGLKSFRQLFSSALQPVPL